MVNDKELGEQSSVSGSGWGFSFRHHITPTLAPTHSRGQQGYFTRGQTDHTVKAYLPSPGKEIINVRSCISIPRKSSWHDELWSTGTNFAFLFTQIMYVSQNPVFHHRPRSFFALPQVRSYKKLYAECLHRSLLHGASIFTWGFSRIISSTIISAFSSWYVSTFLLH